MFVAAVSINAVKRGRSRRVNASPRVFALSVLQP